MRENIPSAGDRITEGSTASSVHTISGHHTEMQRRRHLEKHFELINLRIVLRCCDVKFDEAVNGFLTGLLADAEVGGLAAGRADAAIARILELRDQAHQRCGLPRTLAETGKVKREDLEGIASMSLDDGTMIFNPVEVAYEDALAVLEQAWD